MLKNGEQKRFFFRKDGRDLFFIELTFDDEIGFINFHTSLRYPVFDDKVASDIIAEIVNPDIPDSLRQAQISKLFSYLQTLPDIQNGFFPDYLLDHNGRYLDYYDNVTSELLRDKDFEDYTVFTSEINGFYFDYVRPILERELQENTSVLLDKNTFENLIKNNEFLAQEYVNACSENTKYFLSISSQDTEYECFAMADDFEVKLFFVRRRL